MTHKRTHTHRHAYIDACIAQTNSMTNMHATHTCITNNIINTHRHAHTYLHSLNLTKLHRIAFHYTSITWNKLRDVAPHHITLRSTVPSHNPHTYTHTHTHIYIYIYIHMHYRHTPTDKQREKHTCMQTQRHTCVTCTHA